jgi:hypothetical protein
VRDHVALEAAGVVEVEFLQRFAGREPPDRGLAASGCAFIVLGGDVSLPEAVADLPVLGFALLPQL